MADASRRADAQFDAAAALGPGHGHIRLFGVLQDSGDTGRAGLGLDAVADLSRRVQVFGQGFAGEQWDAGGHELGVEALAGLRVTW